MKAHMCDVGPYRAGGDAVMLDSTDVNARSGAI
jgi:hypothetical protein